MASSKKGGTKKRGTTSNKPRARRGERARAAADGQEARRPTKLSGEQVEAIGREEEGPLGWLLPTMEEAYTRLAPRGAIARPPDAVSAAAPSLVMVERSALQLAGPTLLEPAGPTVWRNLFLEYKRRKAEAAAPARVAKGTGIMPPAPSVPGARNWLPLGPSVVLEGQTVGEQPVAGRVSGLAVAPGGNVIYAATANGGVFRSDDGATTWRSLMDRFDLDPTNFASASLVCGAIAIDASDPRRVYVGTGEGDTLQLFRSRITNALPAYRGVGPIMSDDGGENWKAELSNPDLAGEAFFALAVDPRNSANVVGATTQGLYRRVPRPGGDFEWVQVRQGVYSSVVVASGGGITRFYCAEWGFLASAVSRVFHSDDGGATWHPTGTGLPTNSTGRIALGVQPNNPDLVYAFVARKNGSVHGLYRLAGVSKSWKTVNSVPEVITGRQGDYDLAIAVDPLNANLVYLGGDAVNSSPYPASVWRCPIQAVGTGFRVNNPASIGTRAHADVHVLVHTPGDPTELWCGCDGGVFLNRNPQGGGQFAGQNNGLACLNCNFIGQHPTDPHVIFSGLQDNGTARTAAGPIWKHVWWGDGGYCLVNWNDPDKVLVFMNGKVFRSTTGGASHNDWSPVWAFGWATMTQPIVGAPFDSMNPDSADLVAVAAGNIVYVSEDFAATWAMDFTIPGSDEVGQIFALTFASPDRLYMGTTRGQVFRADRSDDAWSLTRLDDVAAGSIGLDGLITDVAVDWADTSLSSVYISFGGMGDARRVWWFDGAKWEVRSGTAGTTDLLNVEHNALAVDPEAPNNVYVGADIGVWHSSDGGRNWRPMQNGLPDAPVFDLQIHPTQRLLRAATHGRGVFEIALD